VLGHDVNSWWDEMVSALRNGKRREASDAFISTLYLAYAWKERNKCVIHNMTLMPDIGKRSCRGHFPTLRTMYT
jgi:hypothetical protein